MLKWFADSLAHQGSEVRKDERGFTLIELLVVVIIIGILAAIAIPIFLGQRENAQDASAQSNLRNAASAMETYYVDDQSFTDADAAALEDIEPSLTWADTAPTTAGPVGIISASGDSYTLQSQSESGTDFEIVRNANGTGEPQPVGTP